MGVVAEQFGARLRALRNAAFLTQEELAKKAGISSGQIVRYEAGKNIPREAIQISLAEALDVSPLDFYTSDEIPVFIGNEQDSGLVAKRISERIRKLCALQDRDPALLSSFASYRLGQWTRILKGKELPPANWAPKIAEALGVKTPDLLGAIESEEKEEFDKSNYILILLYDINTSKGFIPENKDSLPLMKRQLFNISWVKNEDEIDQDDLLLVPVVGDSMVPTLNQGDLVLVDRSKSHVPDDGLYVLNMDDDLLVKRLRKRPGRKIQVIGDNEIYGSFELDLASPPEEMSVVGRVIWMGRKA